MRAHDEAISGPSTRTRRKPNEVLDYDDAVPGVIELNEPLTSDVVQRLIEQGVSALRMGPKVTADRGARDVRVRSEERLLYVNGELRHIWRDDYAGVRSRIGVGVQRSEITIRAISVTPLGATHAVAIP